MVRLFALMLVAWTGFAIGGNAIESLFFSRFGTARLPVMYILLGVVTFPATMAVGALLARPSRRRILTLLPLAMAIVTAGLRALLVANARWTYPPLWLAMMVLWIVLGIGTWGLAGMVHDTRQAKRLFPLYGAAVILGGALGGLATAPLASWLHAENLVLVWTASLVATWLLASTLTGSGRRRHRLPGPRPRQASLLESARAGYRYVRGSALLRWMSVAALLLNLLYFALSLPFAQAVTAKYPNPDRLAGFLGLFTGVTNLAALAVSVVFAKRLFARLGVPTVVLGLPLVYLVGFLALSLAPGFGPIVGLRFGQLVFMYGVWLTGWQALRGVVTPERREQVRAFMDGGPTQVGVVLAGLLLLAAQAALSTQQLFVVATVVAAAAVATGWQVRRSYRGSLVEALRGGSPEVFVPGGAPFADLAVEEGGLEALAAAALDPDPVVRRIGLEIAAGLPGGGGVDPGTNLGDADPYVRIAALRLAVRTGHPAAVMAALPLLADPSPAVRAAAVDACAEWGEGREMAADRIRPRLDDPDPMVRVRGATALVRLVDDPDAGRSLSGAAARGDVEERAAAIAALGELGRDPEIIRAALDDADPGVRRAATQALARFGSSPATDALIGALADDDPSVSEAAADALVSLGGDGIDGRLAPLLHDPGREAAALSALVRLPNPDPAVLRPYALAEQARALRYHHQWQLAEAGPDGRFALLAAGLRHRALRHAEHAVHALAPFGDHEAVDLALQDLSSRDPNQRANALETVDALSEPAVVRPLLAVWEPVPSTTGPDAKMVRTLLEEEDGWIRACAAFAAGALPADRDLRQALEPLAHEDPDPAVREAAGLALGEDAAMAGDRGDGGLSLLERVMALRQVTLFRDLSPEDLRHLADAVAQNEFPDGAVIAEQDEPGDSLHVVVSGTVRVVVSGPGSADELARRGPGYTVGEMSILGEQPRMANLVAEGRVVTLSLDRPRFQRILRDRPDAALAVMRELSARLREAHTGPRP